MTSPSLAVWPSEHDDGHVRSEVSAVLGQGDAVWSRVSRDVLRWKVKTRSGFTVGGDEPVKPGVRLTITFRLLGITIREPVEVVDVHASSTRVGFSYRTLPGHPVAGEEAFIVSRAGDETSLTVRSLTKPAPQQPWRAMFPALRIAQLVVRRRYLRALRGH